MICTAGYGITCKCAAWRINLKKLDERYITKTTPIPDSSSVVSGDCYRFTILTDRLIRLEYSEEGTFEDRATRTVIDRKFPSVSFRVEETEDSLDITTEHLHLYYDKKRFSPNGLSISVNGNISAYRSIWYYGEEGENLKGTARTLDESNGVIPLENGLLSRNGFAILDDSKSVLLREDGWVEPRKGEVCDLYFFGYGRDYLGCLKDFYKLCGPTPLLPRYALGNWWSRFYRYTEESYKKLLNSFKEAGIPFAVSVLDMDWHLTEVDPKYGSGWTGYSWNKRYYPDPKRFLDWLHKEGLHVTLNVHPADGVRAFEDSYPEMAKELHVNYEEEDKIPFDIANPDFLQAYFKYLHHPHEEIGVDFWWVDWQQGGNSKVPGLDPLWMLNHYHFLDNAREGRRPLAFSRYAGIGSHRYPIGFSGDSFATWETLDFQPYFTATASNAGYGWWSHDISGHMHGYKNDEMAARWIQFGVFSPILRIHSSDNPFNEKEPWKYNAIVEKTMIDFLRLRHKLVPYLYTMNARAHLEGEPLIEPMYYHYPEERESYEVPNQYFYGTELIACPITKPMNKALNLASFKAWLPEGLYFDFFTGRAYRGGRFIELFRDVTLIPVLARAGAIIPMTADSLVENRTDNPAAMEIKIYTGKDGRFQLFEDNSSVTNENDLRTAVTEYEFRWKEEGESSFIIHPVKGEEGVAPERRSYLLHITGINGMKEVIVENEDGESKPQGDFAVTYEEASHSLKIDIKEVDTADKLLVRIKDTGSIAENNIIVETFDLLNKAQIEFDLKDAIHRTIRKSQDKVTMLGELKALDLDKELLGALYEIITAF